MTVYIVYQIPLLSLFSPFLSSVPSFLHCFALSSVLTRTSESLNHQPQKYQKIAARRAIRRCTLGRAACENGGLCAGPTRFLCVCPRTRQPTRDCPQAPRALGCAVCCILCIVRLSESLRVFVKFLFPPSSFLSSFPSFMMS